MKRNFLMLAGTLAIAFVLTAESYGATKELTVTGRLAQTVEAGGWLIRTGGEKNYLVLNARRFSSESWFRAGASVVSEGETKEGIVTIHMEGIPFEARTMRPQNSDGGSNGEGGAGDAGDGNGAQQTAAMNNARATTRVTVSGDAVVATQPDTAILMLAVVTQNASASQAQAINASRSEAVVRAARAAAGVDAEVKTGGYSLQPQYIYRPNVSPTISGYMARNSVTVTLSDLTKVGAVIDAASRAGANSVDNLAFTLRRDETARLQALGDATREALGKAQTIATALGGSVVRILEVLESDTLVRPPVPLYAETRMTATTANAQVQTPIEVGTLDIRAQVQLVAEIETRR